MATGAQDTQALHLIAANVWVGDDTGSAVDFGAVENVSVNIEKGGFLKESDNRGEIVNLVRQTAVVTFDWLEPRDIDRMENLLKGIVTKTAVAGVLVEGEEQVTVANAYAFNDFILIENQNGSGAAIVVNSVTGGTNGLLVEDTDYVVTKDLQGRYGIVIIDSVTVTTMNQTFTIDYDYTPSATKQIEGGDGLKTATYRFLKLEGVDANSKKFDVEIDECSLDGDMTVPYLDPEKAGDIGKITVTMRMKKGTKFRIIDQGNVT